MNYFSIFQNTNLAVALLLILLLLFLLIRTLRRGEKLKYEFVTIIAHKFRTPLSQIKWTIDDMVSSEQDLYKKQNLENVQASNENLIKLTSTLIELADSDNAAKALYHFETINLYQLVRERGDALQQAFHEKNLFFSVQCTDENIWVRADSSRLEFVLQSVLENAITYSPPGRNITVVVGIKGRKAIIDVTDNGIGMTTADLRRIFTKFFRSKEARQTDTEGFGVSLYLARSVIRRHRGTIEAFSEGLQRGSMFVITLPKTNKKD